MKKYSPPYYAFISYCSSDEKWAKWLHKKLEYYHIPTDLCKKYSKLPEKIRPIFWYKQDLSGTKLRKSLHSELEDSKYLIVICSPESANAFWVNDEVQTFIDQGKGDKIIPFIVSGTPHSTNSKEECFPKALQYLSREEEIRGIDVRRKEGKMHALVDVVATMFEIRFDELWNRYERRRKKLLNIAVACLTVLSVIAFGVYDYTRTKKEYFADWVDCNGLAQGIIPLTDNQVSHRLYSYKFEYSRVPFGEKGFYSWRLAKVSIVNSKGVISNYIPENHAFFFPIQDYKYTDGFVTEIVNRDIYNRVVMRYSIKDDYNHKIACLVDIEGKEKHQGSAYLSGSTTTIQSDGNSNMSKIKRFHYTRNKDGYIIKVTYHANDADELIESAIGDNNNIYGKKFDLDNYGRVTKITYLNHEGYPMTDKFGVEYVKFNNATFEGNDTTEYLGRDGKLAYNEKKYARLVSKLNKYGNPTEQYHEGTDGKPCYNSENVYRQVMTYNNEGYMLEMKYYDFEGKTSYCSDNYSIQRAKYDSRGRYIEVSYYDVNNKPCYTKNNYSLSRVQYNSKDCIIERRYFDVYGRPCMNKTYGAHCIRVQYDEYNYITETSVFGIENKPSMSLSHGFHIQKNEYDNYHRIVSCKFYDTKKKRCVNITDYCSECRYTYDTRGNIVKLECIGTQNRPCICKDGFAIISYRYDNYGNIVEEHYYGIDGKPIYKNMCTSIQHDYYSNGLLKEDRYYDEKGNLCLNNNWYAISRYEYNFNGKQTSVEFFDNDTIPCFYKDGLYSSMKFEYDRNGNIIKEKFYDINGNLTLMSKGLYATRKNKYDKYCRILESSYFDEKGKPCYYDKEYHILNVKYDKKGNIIQRSILGNNGEAILSREGSNKIQYSYDLKGNCIRVDYKGINGKNVNQQNHMYSTTIITYDDMNNIINQEYRDKNGKPCMINEVYSDGNNINYSASTYKYDKMGNCIEYAYYDIFGKPTKTMTYAFKYVQYDKMGRVKEEKFKRYDGKLAYGGNHHMSIIRYKYNDNNYVSEVYYYDTDSVLQAHLYQTVKNGYITRKEFRDNKNKLKSIYISGVTDVKCAIMIDSLDEYGKNIKRLYYGENGKLGNIEEGIAVLHNSYDCFGRLIAQEVFDRNGKAVCGKSMKFHKFIIRYNEKGLIREIACFDERNN